MKSLKILKAIFDNTNNVLAFFAAALIIFLMLAVCANVLMRDLLNRTLPWVAEVSGFCLLLITFLGAAWLLRKEGHVSMYIVLEKFSPRTQAIITIVTSLLTAIACVIISWYGFQVALEHFHRGTIMTFFINLPNAYFLVVVAVGGLLLFIQLLIRSYSQLEKMRSLPSNKDEP